MSNAAIHKFVESKGLYPIRTVSDLTGVNAITLRAWERRHGLLEPVRKASGHRLYTGEHIALINRVVGLLERGMRISQVKAHLELERVRVEAESDQGGDIWFRYLNHMVSSIIRFDEGGLEETYGEALSVYPVATVNQKLLAPLLTELGRRWETGEGSVAEEHFFGFYLRNKLGAHFHHRAKTRKGPRLLLACLPGERHETGLLLFALAAGDAGYQTIMLGADMPLKDLPAAARKAGCDAIVLSGLLSPPASIVETDLPAMAMQAAIPVCVGGSVSVRFHDRLKRNNIEPLGMDVGKGIVHMNEHLGVLPEKER